MKTIHAIYRDGVFRPTTPVDLPEGCEVTVEPRRVHGSKALSPQQRRIHELLAGSEDTEDPGFSARHDEHQP